MAYLDNHHTHKRLAGVTGVALVHIALAFGLLTGLTIKYFDPPEPEPLISSQFPTAPVPPPPEEVDIVDTPEPVQTREVIYTPPKPIELAGETSIETTFVLPPIRPVDRVNEGLLDSRISATPQPPAFTPHGPVPANGPGGWVTNNDYPTRALMRGWEGDVSYALDVGADGRVGECRITGGSGQRVLDDATCRWLSRRARFEAAIDSSGSQVAGTYRGTVRWQIPED